MRAFQIADHTQIVGPRQEADACGKSLGLPEEDIGRASLITTELATNLSKHAGGGEILVGASLDSQTPCVEILAIDKGPGMDIEACLADGYSTAGSQGTGLGACRRQATTFDAYTASGFGTAIHIRVCSGRTPYRSKQTIPWGAVVRALAGEDVSGDAVAVRESGEDFVALVADGLGHGPFAADAAHHAADTFQQSVSADAEELVESIHASLRATRGAAIAVANMNVAKRLATFCGIGNISGSLISLGQTKRLTSLNGTAGLVARRVQGFQYPYENDTLLILHSDGLSSSWNLEKYPGLAQKAPTLIAAVLYRDFGRARDDASILVARMVS
ncbi:MAG TPA: SpoIIE family protein phosphatase [Rhizomicrobium sp.]|jgi:anti-sigma regulatory factor (Ser/Thr protein kinase)